MENLSRRGPRRMPPVDDTPAPDPPPPPATNGHRPQQQGGRLFYLKDDLVKDTTRWLSPEEEWSFNGQHPETGLDPKAKNQRGELLGRLLDPFVNEDEALILLRCSRQRLREAVNTGEVEMYRDLPGGRYFSLSQVLSLAERLGGP